MKRSTRSLVTGGLAALLVVCWGAWARAAEFSADVIHSVGTGQTMEGKVFVKGNRIRNEMMSGAEKSVNIIDMDSKKVWVIIPDQKMYMEMVASGEMAAAAQKREEIEQMAEVKALGTEKVEGYECDKMLYTYRDKRMGVMTQWIAKELNYPIKFVYEGPQGKTTMDYKNIRKGGVSDSLFTVPPDYKKMSMPGTGKGM